jgi:hypothetical protein
MREDFSALRIRLLNSDNPKVRQLVADVDGAVEIYERDGEPDHSQEQCQLARDLGIGDAWVIARWRGSKVRRNEKVLAERRKEQVASIIQKAQAQPKPDEKKNDPKKNDETIVKLPYRLLPRQWSELKVPSGLSELEKLTYVPGLVGDIIEWIVRTAPRRARSQ